MYGRGKKLRQLREAAGLTQKELACKAHLSESAIRMWELGERKPKPKAVQKLADALRVSPKVFNGYDVEDEDDCAHVLMRIEDEFGLMPAVSDEKPVILAGDVMGKFIGEWAEARERLSSGRMSRQEYERWKDSYAGLDVKR